jgi:UDP-N-acetylglucosamine 2-epimerase (non-hydrolysing)
MLIEMEKILIKERPDIALVEGDTNTVLAGALAASKLGIKVGHIEAGLRSYFNEMPEETNRILADHCSDFLFAPTKETRRILLKEGITSNKIFVVGNTATDAVYRNLILSDKKSKILKKLKLRKNNYLLVTTHRQENVDKKERLTNIMVGLEMIGRKFNLPIIYSLHPRAAKMIEKFGLSTPAGVEIIEPVGFLDFLQLEANARLILTDSGGVQEEACILKVPCVTLRDNTERPETIAVGANVLAGVNPEKIVSAAKKMFNKTRKWRNPFGNGRSGEKILNIILKHEKK